jgi:hypothetical protein
MNGGDRVVIVMPLQVLWTDDGELPAKRGRWLGRDAVHALLQLGPVRFVIANVGERLRWVSLEDRFKFWKEDVVLRLADTDRVYLDDFPGAVAYFASEWVVAANELPIILLEVHH